MKKMRNELRRNLPMIKTLLSTGRVQTIHGRAKALQPTIEKYITKGKKYHIAKENSKKLHIRRVLLSELSNNNDLVESFLEIGKKYESRSGGYTKVLKTMMKNSMQFCSFQLS